MSVEALELATESILSGAHTPENYDHARLLLGSCQHVTTALSALAAAIDEHDELGGELIRDFQRTYAVHEARLR